MHADERLRYEEGRGSARESAVSTLREPSRDGLLLSVLSATRTPEELEQLAHRLLDVAAQKRQHGAAG